MKAYEDVPRIGLTKRMPLIIRLDGVAFHSYTRGFEKPLDMKIVNASVEAMKALIKRVQGAKLIYAQSDEISILVNDYENFDTQPWFDKSLQKIVSVSAATATAYFNRYMWNVVGVSEKKVALFDSRAFVLPKEEVCNYFWWRELDAERNSVSSLAQANFSAKTLHKKSASQMRGMLFDEKGINWDTLSTLQKRGWCVLQGDVVDFEIPRFNESRDYIDKHLAQIEE